MPHFIYHNIVRTTIILYIRPNWYALVISCIDVNHCKLLVRCHLKYLWFTKLRNFEVRWKMAPPSGYPKQKSFQLQGAWPPWTPDQGLCHWTPLGAPPQTRERSPSSKFATTLLVVVVRVLRLLSYYHRSSYHRIVVVVIKTSLAMF